MDETPYAAHDDARASALDHAIAAVACVPTLLVVADFDGTIAPIAPRPDDVQPDRDALVALRTLATLASTHVAVLSGRALGDLAARLGALDGVLLVGSHGSEFEADFAGQLDERQRALRGELRAVARDVADGHDGVHVEEKPAGVALHVRLASEERGASAVRALRERIGGLDGVYVKDGKKVIELSVVPMQKGIALGRIRQRVGASAVVFLGDDRTDEDAFDVLRGPDVSVKVGEGETAAAFRVADPRGAARTLARLATARERWLRAGSCVPIERLSILSDQRTAALVDPNGSIVWCCLPRIDGPALFAALLGGPNAGRFSVRPVDERGPARQRYLGDSFLLESAWDTLRVTDCLDCSAGRAFLRAGRTDMLRRIEGSAGTEIEIEFAPRLDFGRHPTRLRPIDDGLTIEGALDPVVLRAPGVRFEIVSEGTHETARARHRLDGTPLVLELRYGVSTAQELVVPSPQRFDATQRFWELWAKTLAVPTTLSATHAESIRRSALVLKALCYGPSGGLAAAATTSLPEALGGVRNWDYRFAWLRDAAISSIALARLGSPGIGTKFLDWVLALIDRDGPPESFRPVYTVTGNHLHAEAEIAELAGYAGSRPVRVGNAAGLQLQLDVFGPLLELVATLAAGGLALSADHWRLTESIVHAVESRWTEPDHGIWEIRGPLRHHVHSRTMCWMAVDRGIAIARAFAAKPPPSWIALRDAIAHDVLANGYSTEAGSFVASYGSLDIDAAALHVGLSGLVAGNDERFVRTVDRVERELREGPTVFRYRYDDGLPGTEGGFHFCTTWLIEALVLIGRRERAQELFDAYVALAGPTGLMPEEYDPLTRQSLGNHPQAYSHAGLITAALALHS
ncbi:MAG: trehalose-phosphatase [Phycisphaerae bacterium]|nr:trehalose-phosphatase [Phycisphaerae bacterium]